MNRRLVRRGLAASGVVLLSGTCLCALAQVPSGPIAPVKRLEFKKYDPFQGAKVAPLGPGAGSAYQTVIHRPAAARSGGYTDAGAAPGRARTAGYTDPGAPPASRVAPSRTWKGDDAGMKNVYR